jgi:hypothetical protein
MPTPSQILNVNRVAWFIIGFMFGFGVTVVWVAWLIG